MQLQNPGTPDATGDLKCKACGYVGDVSTYAPAMSVYQDICCPKCGSTNNEHNAVYQDRLFASMKKASVSPSPESEGRG